jgi:hypothetical protein
MRPTPIVFISAVVIVSVMVANYLYVMSEFCAFTERGQFGDMFGFSNALFSGLAFAGVIYTLYIQSKDLKEQRFETVFFQLLTLHKDIVNAMDFHGKKGERKGRDVFRTYYFQLKRKVKSPTTTLKDFEVDKGGKSKSSDYRVPIEEMLEHYCAVFDKRQSDLGHYFRNLYHTYRFLDEADIIDKNKYARILRAQFSSYELVFLFYNGLSKHGVEKFKPLMIKYGAIKNMDWDLLFNEAHADAYPDAAYE